PVVEHPTAAPTRVSTRARAGSVPHEGYRAKKLPPWGGGWGVGQLVGRLRAPDAERPQPLSTTPHPPTPMGPTLDRRSQPQRLAEQPQAKRYREQPQAKRDCRRERDRIAETAVSTARSAPEQLAPTLDRIVDARQAQGVPDGEHGRVEDRLAVR